MVLIAPRMGRDRKVSRQTRAVSVVSGDVSWGSGIEGLDVDEDKRVGPIIVMKDDVGRVRDWVGLHPLVNRALASVSAPLSRYTRGAKGRVKERNEGLNGGIMARGVESHAVRAPDEVPVARASKGVAQGLGDGGAGGAAGDVALPLRGRSEEEIKGEGNWEVTGVLEGEEGCVAGVAGGDGEAPEPREGTLWAALPSRRRARPVAVVAGSFKRARKARDATTAEAAL